jgi:hypothetical protein
MVRWLVRLVVALVVLVALAFAVARLHDGPLGPLPGGPLRAGDLVAEPVADWSFARDTAEIELQLASQDSSRTTWILVLDEQAYVPASLEFPPGKRWHREAARDGRATLRIDGRRYPVTLVKLDDAEVETLRPKLEAEVDRKYPQRPRGDGGIWMFRVTSRRAAGA